MAAEDVLHEREVFREEERLREAEQRRTSCIEIMQLVADLERDRDHSVNCLRRFSSQTISKFTFSRIEDAYIAPLNLDSELNLRISEWEDLLDLNKDGTPEYPN